MEASPVRVIQYFDGTKQNVIPLFQRPYSWDQPKWETLWQDILAQYDLGGIGTAHFMGAVVSVPAKAVPVGVSKYLIVDGQQRLTTIALLLCALRAYLNAQDSGKVADYLINRHYEGADRLKLLPNHSDRAFYTELAQNGSLPSDGLMRQAVLYFRKRIEDSDLNEQPIKPPLILQTIEQCLQVVMINLSDTDDPYLIFESLNAKGEPLTQADLVRNYILMRFKNSLQANGEQEQVYVNLWKPLQDSLGASLTDFLRHYRMKDGDDIKKNGIYAAVKNRIFELKEPVAVEQELRTMKRHGEFYSIFVTPRLCPSDKVRTHLQAFIDIDSTTCYPLLLKLFESHHQGSITSHELEESLGILESFLVRRILCGLPTNALNKIFPQLAREYRDKNVCDWLSSALLLGTGPRRWPNDEELRQAILSQPQYGRKTTKYVLLKIEKSFDHKEPVDFVAADLTIEHVLPQTLNDSWRDALGPNFELIHAREVNTLGNLTLTGYNSELGNMPFKDKRQFFADSHLEINKWIAIQDRWDEKSIADRAEVLTESALDFWPRPNTQASQVQDLVPVIITNLQTGGWDKNSAIYDLYRRLSDQQSHTRAELETVVAGRANVDDRLARIRRRGNQRNLWNLEQKDGSFRLTFTTQPADAGAQR
jgi:hypothetical protein